MQVAVVVVLAFNKASRASRLVKSPRGESVASTDAVYARHLYACSTSCSARSSSWGSVLGAKCCCWAFAAAICASAAGATASAMPRTGGTGHILMSGMQRHHVLTAQMARNTLHSPTLRGSRPAQRGARAEDPSVRHLRFLRCCFTSPTRPQHPGTILTRVKDSYTRSHHI